VASCGWRANTGGLVGIESPLWPRTGSGSGWIANEAFETFLGTVRLEALPCENLRLADDHPHGGPADPFAA